MRIGDSYRQHDISGTFDAIVIGSGIGGLCAAALLARHADKRVLVLERHYTAGGFTHTFHRPRYEWDVGVHYIGQVTETGSPLRQLFDDITDGRLAWADMGAVYDRILIGDDTYDFPKGKEAFREQLHQYFPNERHAIDTYLDRIKTTVKSAGLYFAEKSVPAPISRAIGGLMRWPLLRHARRTTRDTLEAITDNARLVGVLTGQYGDYGLTPARSSFFIHSLIATHYLEGAAYPVGGSSRMAATIAPVIESAGGRVFTNAEVSEIVIENDRAVGVRLADGNELRAPIVISDAGVATTYRRLLNKETRASFGVEDVLSRHEPSIAHISLYLGFRETASQLGLEKTNLWIYPDHDHDANHARFLTDENAPLPVAYVSFPSAKDPDFERRHPGRATVEVITLAPYEWFAKWADKPWKKRGSDYDELKGKLTERLLDKLYTHCPQLKGKVDFMELSTPLSTRHFTGHAHGEIYGLAATPAFFDDRALRPRTPIPGLYLTGSDVCTLGVGGALSGGMLTAGAILGRDLRGTIAKGAREIRGITSAAATAAG